MGKKNPFNWTTVGWAFYALPMKSKKMEGWPVLMVKTKVVNFNLHLPDLFCSSPWVNAGGVSV